jgi:hypothetical protein
MQLDALSTTKQKQNRPRNFRKSGEAMRVPKKMVWRQLAADVRCPAVPFVLGQWAGVLACSEDLRLALAVPCASLQARNPASVHQRWW